MESSGVVFVKGHVLLPQTRSFCTNFLSYIVVTKCVVTKCAGGRLVERASQFVVAFWHQVTMDLHLADYSRTDPAGHEVMAPTNPGPCYTSRAFAMTHLAMHDAFVGISGDAQTYLTFSDAVRPGAVRGAAITCLFTLELFHGA
jgi:hypothetical protein